MAGPSGARRALQACKRDSGVTRITSPTRWHRLIRCWTRKNLVRSVQGRAPKRSQPWHWVRAMRNAKQTPEQHRADFVAAQEFHQIQKFAAACRRRWPGAKIVLRPDSDRGRNSSTPRGEARGDGSVRQTNLGNCKILCVATTASGAQSFLAAEQREKK